MMRNQIPSATLDQILPGLALDLPLKVSSSIFSDMTSEMPILLPHEQMLVAALVRHLAPQRLFEFGTASGRTTWILAENSPEDARVATLDLPPVEQTRYSEVCLGGHAALGAVWRSAPAAHKVTQLFADARTLDPAGVVAEHGAMDFVLVDGDHTYVGVRSDTEKALALATPDAVFLWHDFYLFDYVAADPPLHHSVYHYLNEFASGSDLVLRHIVGTYFVIGSRRFAADMPGRVLQPPTNRFGAAVVRLRDTAGDFMRPAASAGYAAGMAAYRRGDFASAFAAWRPLAERGHGEAAAGLGTMMMKGEGGPPNMPQAAHWYRAAAEAGHVLAQLNLAILHFDGQGVPRDHRLAAFWAERAAAALPAGPAQETARKLRAAAA